MIYIEDYVVAHKGMGAKKNQDNIFVNGFYLDKENNGIKNYSKKENKKNNNLVYGVFDGIGGLNQGEYASYISVTMLKKLLSTTTIKKALLKINNELVKIKKEEKIDMGTTASIVKVKKNKLIINQVGDSPIYILSGDKFVKLVEQDNNVNLLDNYLGKNKKINISQKSFELNNNDKILICSDGLTSAVGDLEIEYYLSESNDIKYIANKLMNYALMDGGKDNISIIILRVKKDYTNLISIIIMIVIFIVFSILFII